MAGTLGIVTGVVVSASGVTMMARIRGQGGSYITQASLSSITYSIRDLSTATTTGTGSLTVSSVVFDNLQLDNRWTKDAIGYNFRTTFASGSFDNFDVGDSDDAIAYQITRHRYQVDIRFVPASGQGFNQPFQFSPIPTWA